MAQISFSCSVMRPVLLRYVSTSTLSVYSETCIAASNSLSSFLSSMSRRRGMYLARSTKFMAGSRLAAAAAIAAASSSMAMSPLSPLASSSIAAPAPPSPPPSPPSPPGAPAPALLTSSMAVAAIACASALAPVAASARSTMPSTIARITASSPWVPAASDAMPRTFWICSPKATDSSALALAYSANCCRATSRRRRPSLASDSACARPASARSNASDASVPLSGTSPSSSADNPDMTKACGVTTASLLVPSLDCCC
mmetsp:Transcript_24334/g.60482  ORF Transcript_24334/g.60482 Transcript_24334/m.60482 type:complete len:257 (-) Transcript_24334:117-887(-)